MTESNQQPAMVDEDVIQQLVDLHAVYRLLAASGRLLYVGMTNELGRRLDQHTEKRWFPQVKTITLQWFPTKEDARRAEQHAIRAEHPVHNIAGARRPPKRPPIAATLLAADQMTLAEAVIAGLLQRSLDAARKASQRPGFPAPAGRRGIAKLYAAEDLRAYQERKGRVA
jgi:predicted GIY-YIG superfamily endonuclease